MENKSHALAAGAFVLVVAVLMAALAVWLTRDNSVQRVFEISSSEGVTGLQPQAGVRYKGVTVGRVLSIDLDRDVPGNVLVRIAVNEAAPITAFTFASLGFQGVTGLAFVQLDEEGVSTQMLATSPDKPARIPMRAGLIARLSDQGTDLLSKLDTTSEQVNLLLAPDNQKILMEAIGNLGKAAASVQQLAQQAQQVLGKPGELNLPQLAQQADASLKSMQSTAERLSITAGSMTSSADEFKRMSTRMTASGGTLDKIAQGADALTATGQALNATLLPRLNRTADDTARLSRQVGRAVETVNDNPKALLVGKEALLPGPGEPGFVAPAAR